MLYEPDDDLPDDVYFSNDNETIEYEDWEMEEEEEWEKLERDVSDEDLEGVLEWLKM